MIDPVCRVCSEPMDTNRATCNHCGEQYHLALRTDVKARDCGDAWIDEDTQALVFGCNVCLGRTPKAPERKQHVRREGAIASSVVRSRVRNRPQ